MAFVYPGAGALDYAPCRYGTSRVVFRGPAKSLDVPYVAVLGGTETYGKFVPEPYPALVEAEAGVQVVNLGAVNAGLDVYLNDPDLLEIARGAEVVVVQIVGAQNLSNRFYKVHRRRNDRFLGAHPALRALFPEVDFTEFSFTRHMLHSLQKISVERFDHVVEELRATWLARMQRLMQEAGTRVVLLWFSPHRPPRADRAADLTREPLLVTAEMLARVRPMARAVIEVVSSSAALAEGARGLAFTELEEPAARGVPGLAAHRDVAARLAVVLRQMLE
ncbi:MAG: hypothetical protein JNN06_08695 [Gemmobacter sp.]|uniref:DUF6473 family protein n=1 Tax=Gemmobacter sp. TaxID=1898957 RepID=UPI001A441CBB|nr:DUF6473 family protein [Gemmobacter sp.]MBL8562344.1 hypothetical protein [Gemmobacter sp.]